MYNEIFVKVICLNIKRRKEILSITPSYDQNRFVESNDPVTAINLITIIQYRPIHSSDRPPSPTDFFCWGGGCGLYSSNISPIRVLKCSCFRGLSPISNIIKFIVFFFFFFLCETNGINGRKRYADNARQFRFKPSKRVPWFLIAAIKIVLHGECTSRCSLVSAGGPCQDIVGRGVRSVGATRARDGRCGGVDINPFFFPNGIAPRAKRFLFAHRRPRRWCSTGGSRTPEGSPDSYVFE